MRISSGSSTFLYNCKSELALKSGFSDQGFQVSSPLFASGSDKQGSPKRLLAFIQAFSGWLSVVKGKGSLTISDKVMMDRLKFVEKSIKKGGPMEVRRYDIKFPDGGKGTTFSFINKEPNTYYLLTDMTKGDGYKLYKLVRTDLDNPTGYVDLDVEIPVKVSPKTRVMFIEADSEGKLKNVEYFSKNPKLVKAFKGFLEKLASRLEKQLPPSQQAEII